MWTYFKTLDESTFSEHIYNYFLFPRGERYSNAALENFNRYLKAYVDKTHGVSERVLEYTVLFGKLSRRTIPMPFTREDVDKAINYDYVYFKEFTSPTAKWYSTETNEYNNDRHKAYDKMTDVICSADRHLFRYVYHNADITFEWMLRRKFYEIRQQFGNRGICSETAQEWYKEVYKIHPLSDLIDNFDLYCYLGVEDTAFLDMAEKDDARIYAVDDYSEFDFDTKWPILYPD